MNAETITALKNFTAAVTSAIARQQNGRDVDWRDIIALQELLESALDKEPTTDS